MSPPPNSTTTCRTCSICSATAAGDHEIQEQGRLFLVAIQLRVDDARAHLHLIQQFHAGERNAHLKYERHGVDRNPEKPSQPFELRFQVIENALNPELQRRSCQAAIGATRAEAAAHFALTAAKTTDMNEHLVYGDCFKELDVRCWVVAAAKQLFR